MSALSTIATVARRELGAYFHAPIAYVVGVLFLAVQGFSFWAVVRTLADPAQPAPAGAVLHTYFGGTVLFWGVLFLVVSVLAMRTIAEERRQGTWEALVTAPVDEGPVVVGKWLGALGFYAMLWAPTLAYPLVLWVYAPPGAALEVGPVAAAYLAVIAYGAGFLALGVAASAATSNQIVAAVVAFVLQLAMLLVGELDDVAPTMIDGRLAAVVRFVDLRAHMDAMARGAIDLEVLILCAALIAVGLVAASTLAVAGRRRSPEVRARTVATGLVGIIAVLVAILAGRHPVRWDVTAADVNVLDPRTEAILDRADEPIDVLVVRPTDERFERVYDQVDRLLERMQRAQPLLERRDVDPVLEDERVAALAAEFAIPLGDLAEGGAVVFQRGERRRAVDLLDMAGFDRDDLGVGALSRFHAEEEFASAILELVERERMTLCRTSGHGELPWTEDPDRSHWGAVARRLEREGAVVEDVGRVAGGVPTRCRALLVIGPGRPLEPVEARAVADYLAGGGRLLLAAAVGEVGRDPDARLPDTGLALVTGELGVGLPAAVVVDPPHRLELPLTWMTAEGYGDHPITSSYQGRRLTVWQRPRALDVGEPATALVASSGSGWGETDLAALALGGAELDGGDIAGPVPVAAAARDPDTGARMVVLGSARSVSSHLVGRGIGAQDALVAGAVAWLVGQTRRVDIGDKAPQVVRLVMTDAQLAGVFVACVVALPLVFAGVGGGLWWRRRRG